MAEEKSFTLLNVSGYLQVPEKIGRKATKKRWCLFDERTCSLKYYKDQTSCKERGNEPLGEINLASAKLTSFVAEGSSKPSNQFFITTDEGSYQLQAKDNKEALEWIRKLQDKRSEYHKAGYARENQDEAPKVQTIPRTPGPGGLLEGSPDSSPVGVRKIMQQILSPSPALAPLYLAAHASDKDATRRPSFDSLDVCSAQFLMSRTPSDDATDGSPVFTATSSPQQTSMTPEELKLEYYKSQETSTSYYKEVQKLKQKLEQKDITIRGLIEEILSLKEQIASMSIPIPVTQLQEEKANLELTLRQVLENIKLMLKEVDEHRERANQNEMLLQREKERNAELERNINTLKTKYVHVLVQSLPISTIPDITLEPNRNACLVELLKEEGWETEGVFEDEYGDVHDWNTDTNVQHFLCRCLYLHYTQHEKEELAIDWVENLPQASLTTFDRPKTEFRDMLRKGLPIHFRKQVWTSLINRHVAKIKEVKGHTCGGMSYYQSLLNLRQKSLSAKIIEMDIHRTMPGNKYFKCEGAGIKKLENVLVAYSIHNQNVGYCQGMNFFAALGLLYLDEETTFWYMVAIIDKILPNDYYSTGLLGAQADQTVLQEIVAAQIPDLSEHLLKLNANISLVTFNWFLTVFTDAMPTECALRIMDVFLNEGHKFMHRVAIGILKMYKDKFLSMHDPITMFQFLKALTHHTYNVEELFTVAFDRQFPSRGHLSSRHSHHLNHLKQEWQEWKKEEHVHKEAPMQVLAPPLPPQVPPQQTRRIPQWECGGYIGKDTMCLCSGEKDQGIISVITVGQEPQMKIIPDMVIKGRAVCMKYISSCDMVLIGTLDFYVYAVDCLTWKELWSLRFIDSVLTMEAVDNIVFFALAEGSVAVIKNIDRSYPLSEPLLIRIGSSSVPCLALVPNQMLWCGSEKSITVLSTVTCELEKSVVMNDDGTGKIYKMKCGQQGVWVSFRSSTIICLFDVDRYTKLLQVDYVTLPTLETHERITYLLPVQGYLWLGTGDGTIHVLSVKARELPQQVEAHTTGQQTNSTAVASKSSVASSCGRVATEDKEEREGEEERRRLEEERHNSEDPTKLRDNRRERKTKFGAALHNRRPRPTENVGTLDAYELEIETSKHVVESRKEPVRTIQACQGPDNSTIVVSTVHTESDKAVQLWRCSDQNAANWDMVYL